MKMVLVHQSWVIRIAPWLGVEMQTKHEIGMQLCVHERGATTDFAVAVKQNFTLPANGLLFLRIIGVEKLPAYAGLRDTIFDQDFFGKLLEIVRAFCGDG